ncbi:hypothetical protein CGRA01v4_01180 [Colletotrichum graminicola]|uniref:Uncharacterized protein n=1 Tax=Colletotrichum graminicola (strain M1.001 / M2 / FGSC 10212) TaxID=645133 RepID=E3QGG3_COLGM|nr:uncharacterized protein GLRG_05095 [Colletotrichum graminicola M1.001]EFQ29951.1 hypothetical protein GLRG_05095 [Colletotrichum graminicola M1.001]WDK09902.1 hypothetical protein CGRA01v4_01180 [Colletotrichum graminicola]
MSASYYTPQRPYFPSPQHSSSSSAARPAAAGTPAPPSFTPAMRDRQARGKDPYSPHDSPSDSDLDFDGVDSPSRGVGSLGHLGPGHGHAHGGAATGGGVGDGDSHEVRRRKLWAVSVLEDPERLAMYACSRGDSIPGTRLYFTRILCGFDEEPADPRKAASASRRDPRRRSAGGERMGRH